MIQVNYRRGLGTTLVKVPIWLGAATGVQVVVVISIYETVAGNVPMLALAYHRGAANNPVTAISFGTRQLHATIAGVNNFGGAQIVGVGIGGAAACNAANIPLYQLQLPSVLLLNGVNPANLPAGYVIPANYTLDLFMIQQEILASY